MTETCKFAFHGQLCFFFVYSPADFELSSWQKSLAQTPLQSYNATTPKRETLPNQGQRKAAAPGREAFLTTLITTDGCGARGNSGCKSV